MMSTVCVLKLLCLLGLVSAGRQQEEGKADALLQVEVGTDAAVVPPELSRARQLSRKAAVKAAEVAKQQQEEMEAALKEAEVKAAEANEQMEVKDLAAKTAIEEVEKEQLATASSEEAAKTDDDLNKAWQEALETLKDSEAKMTEAEKSLADREAEINALKAQLDEELKDLMKDVTEWKEKHSADLVEEADKRDQALSAGAMKTAKADELATVRAVVQAAQVKHEELTTQAEKASSEADMLRAVAADATSAHQAAVLTYQEKKNCHDLTENVWLRVDAFYKDVDELTQDMMERTEEESNKDSKAWELLRENKWTKPALSKYNLVVLSYKTLAENCPDIYKFVFKSIDTVKQSAHAQIRLVCDPVDELFDSGDEAKIAEHCGPGLWEAVGLEEQS